jgi:SAM-dependent methyltransferase
VLGVNRSLFRTFWALSAVGGRLGNAFLYTAVGFLRDDDLAAAARDEWSVASRRDAGLESGLSPDERTFYASILRSGDRILLVGCGAGRDLIALMALGYEVDGLDQTPDAVEIARAELARRRWKAAVRAAPIQTAALDGTYDAAIFSSGCYALIRGSKARMAALANVRAHLSPSGRIILGYYLSAGQSAIGRWIVRSSARMARADWSPEAGDVFWRHRNGGLRYRRSFTRAELAAELGAAGFRKIAEHDPADPGDVVRLVAAAPA